MGVEPMTPGSEVQCSIHWAKGAVHETVDYSRTGHQSVRFCRRIIMFTFHQNFLLIFDERTNTCQVHSIKIHCLSRDLDHNLALVNQTIIEDRRAPCPPRDPPVFNRPDHPAHLSIINRYCSQEMHINRITWNPQYRMIRDMFHRTRWTSACVAYRQHPYYRIRTLRSNQCLRELLHQSSEKWLRSEKGSKWTFFPKRLVRSPWSWV